MYKEGDRVYFVIGHIKGTGHIRGYVPKDIVYAQPMPNMKKYYVVQIENINHEMPYSCLVMAEDCLARDDI